MSSPEWVIILAVRAASCNLHVGNHQPICKRAHLGEDVLRDKNEAASCIFI